MKISSLLDYTNWDQFRLPAFVLRKPWPQDKVIELLNSLYRGYPLGGFVLHEPLTVPADESTHRKAIVDGVERIVAIYSALRGRMPLFVAGADHSVCSLCFDLDREQFVVRGDELIGNPRFISLVEFFASDRPGVGKAITDIHPVPSGDASFGEDLGRVMRLAGIVDRSLYMQYMPIDASAEDCQTVREIANGG